MIDRQLAASRDPCFEFPRYVTVCWEAEAADLTFFVNFRCSTKNGITERTSVTILRSFSCMRPTKLNRRCEKLNCKQITCIYSSFSENKVKFLIKTQTEKTFFSNCHFMGKGVKPMNNETFTLTTCLWSSHFFLPVANFLLRWPHTSNSVKLC